MPVLWKCRVKFACHRHLCNVFLSFYQNMTNKILPPSMPKIVARLHARLYLHVLSCSRALSRSCRGSHVLASARALFFKKYLTNLKACKLRKAHKKFAYQYFLLWRPRSLTHTVCDAANAKSCGMVCNIASWRSSCNSFAFWTSGMLTLSGWSMPIYFGTVELAFISVKLDQSCYMIVGPNKRCLTHSPLATCGEWLFKCVTFEYFWSQ